MIIRFTTRNSLYVIVNGEMTCYSTKGHKEWSTHLSAAEYRTLVETLSVGSRAESFDGTGRLMFRSTPVTMLMMREHAA